MNRLVVDSWAWIEYLDGTERGRKVGEFLEGREYELYCSSVSVAEVVSRFIRKQKDPALAFRAMAHFSKIVDADGGLASEAGEVHANRRKNIPDFGLADAFVIVVAERLSAKIVTGDPHFKHEKNAIIL